MPWNQIGNLRGPQGVQGPQGPAGPAGADGAAGPAGSSGAAGNSIHADAGAPADNVGNLTDLYIDTANGNLYRKV